MTTTITEDVQLGKHRILARSGLVRHPAFMPIEMRVQAIAWRCPCERCAGRRKIVRLHQSVQWPTDPRGGSTGAFDLAAYPHIDAVLEALL